MQEIIFRFGFNFEQSLLGQRFTTKVFVDPLCPLENLL